MLILFLTKARIVMSTSDKYDFFFHVQNHQKYFQVEFY